MDYETEQHGFEDDNRAYRERSPRAENGDRARSASPNGRERLDSRPPPPPPHPAEEEEDEDARNPGSNLFVTGIHPRLTEEDVTRLFEKYGEVEKCNIMRDPHTRDSRGFGFVNMVTPQQADAAKEGLQGEVYEGRTLSIEKARRSKPRTPTPGKYFGPPKRDDFRGPPRGGSRYGGDRFDRSGGRDAYRGSRRDEPYGGYRGGDRYGSRGGERYDDRGYSRRDRYDERPPREDRYGGGSRRGGRDYYEGGGSRGMSGEGAYGDAAGAGGNGGGGRGYDDRAGDDRYSRR